MNEKIESISAFWFCDKKTPIEESAILITNFLLKLKDNNKIFYEWYEKAYSQKEALKNKVVLEKDYFEKTLKKEYRKVDETLGTYISYWTGNTTEGNSANISFNLGGYGEKSFNKNSCVISLPQNDSLYNQEEREQLLKLMIEYWKPSQLRINGIDCPEKLKF